MAEGIVKTLMGDEADAEPLNDAQEKEQEELESKKEEDQDGGEDGDQEKEPESQKEKDVVPLRTLLEERNEKRIFKQELEGAKEEIRSLREKLDSFFEAQKPPAPDKDEAPLDYLDHKITDLSKKIDDRSAKDAETFNKRQVEELQREVTRDEHRFAKEHPDYWDSLEYLRDARLDYFSSLNIPQEVAQRKVMEEYADLVAYTTKTGGSVAEAAYQLAQKSGYKPPKVEDKAEAKKETKAKTLKEIAQEKGANSSLSSSGGKKKNDAVTAEDAASLDDAQFDKLFVGRDNEENWKRLWNQ